MIAEERRSQAAAQPRAAAFLLGARPTVGEILQGATDVLRAAGSSAEPKTGPTTELRTGLGTPRLDAEVLLAHTLGTSRAGLLARLDEPLPAPAQTTYTELIERRCQGEPVAYLTHNQEFYGLDFYVDQRVLIPRPETELLVERAIEIHNSQFTIHNSQLSVADVGTGSGCIAVALAVNLPAATIYATEASAEALEVAQINIDRHEVADRVRLFQSDLLRNVDPETLFHVIVANLPYVSEAELAELPRSVRDYEPVERALAAGPDGLAVIRRLLRQAPARLHPGGVILLEIGAAQGAAASGLARRHFPDAGVRVLQDLAGLDRVIEIRTNAER